jgi:hypothetical protein
LKLRRTFAECLFARRCCDSEGARSRASKLVALRGAAKHSAEVKRQSNSNDA